MTIYAQDTSVPVEKSRAEIEGTLARYGATEFAYMHRGAQAIIGFTMNGKGVRFILPLPNPAAFNEREYTRMGKVLKTVEVSPEVARKAWEQACRSRWRSLALCVKAKLEACASGITTFETEFLAHFVLPGGGTIGDRLLPQLEELQKGGRLPRLSLTDGHTEI